MANPNDTPAPEKPLTAGCQQESCCEFFICPDGDLLPRKPAEAIWIEEVGNWWNRKYSVCLQFNGTNTHEWEWQKKTRAEAVDVRDRLISIFKNV